MATVYKSLVFVRKWRTDQLPAYVIPFLGDKMPCIFQMTFFAEDDCVSWNEDAWISNKNSLKLVSNLIDKH